MKERLGHYPFAQYEDPYRVHQEFAQHLGNFLIGSPFSASEAEDVSQFITDHFSIAESYFLQEDEDRKAGRENANLFYHCKEHAVYQTGYDTVSTVKAILARGDKLSSHLSKEGIVAPIIAAVYHDVGYVYNVYPDENYAARLPIHVDAGINVVDKLLSVPEVKIPSFLNKEKLKNLVKLGIHATNFPILDEHRMEAKEWLSTLSPKDRKEAHIVRIAVQLGDLGGQVARNDYLENLNNLRKEMNAYKPGLGDDLIGNGEEMLPKCCDFVENAVKPTVGKSANAIFGSEQNIFSLQWERYRR